MHGGQPIVPIVVDRNGCGTWLVRIHLVRVAERKIRVENVNAVCRSVGGKLKAIVNLFATVVRPDSDGERAYNVEADLPEGCSGGLAVVAIDHVVVRIVSV